MGDDNNYVHYNCDNGNDDGDGDDYDTREQWVIMMVRTVWMITVTIIVPGNNE